MAEAVGWTVTQRVALLSEGFSSSRLASIANVATFCSVVVYLSPVSSIFTVCLRGTSRDVDCAPYAIMLGSSVLWTFYGAQLHDLGILRINAVGALTSVVFGSLLVGFADSSNRLYTSGAYGFVVAFLGVYLSCCFSPSLVKSDYLRMNLLGYMATVLSVSVAVGPLIRTLQVVRTRRIVGVPVGLICCSFASSLLWGQYSIMVWSIPFLVPNVVGIVLNGSQLILLLYAYCQQPHLTTNRGILLEGRARAESLDPLVARTTSSNWEPHTLPVDAVDAQVRSIEMQSFKNKNYKLQGMGTN